MKTGWCQVTDPETGRTYLNKDLFWSTIILWLCTRSAGKLYISTYQRTIIRLFHLDKHWQNGNVLRTYNHLFTKTTRFGLDWLMNWRRVTYFVWSTSRFGESNMWIKHGLESMMFITPDLRLAHVTFIYFLLYLFSGRRLTKSHAHSSSGLSQWGLNLLFGCITLLAMPLSCSCPHSYQFFILITRTTHTSIWGSALPYTVDTWLVSIQKYRVHKFEDYWVCFFSGPWLRTYKIYERYMHVKMLQL